MPGAPQSLGPGGDVTCVAGRTFCRSRVSGQIRPGSYGDGVFVDDALCFGGSPETRWVHHLQQRPDATASLPDDDHAVILEGQATLVTDADLPVAKAMAPANRAKYPQYFTDDDGDGEFQPFWCLRPARIYAW